MTIFLAQNYLFYFQFVPAALAPFKHYLELHDHVEFALNKTLGWSFFWFLVLIANICGYLIFDKKRSRE